MAARDRVNFRYAPATRVIEPAKMHLTIGVTGHRDLVAEEIPALRDRVRDFFLQLQGLYPDLELQLISPLAEGSDQLVAAVALQLGIALIVPLPMAQADYEKDFTTSKALAKFRVTLQQGRGILLPTRPRDSDDQSPAAAADRNDIYARLGVFISNHSHVLLALWDGKPSTKTGGTASVVNYHLTAVMPGYSVAEESPNLLADNENDLAFHIICSRNRPDGQPKAGLRPFQTRWITAHFGYEAGTHMPPDYALMLHRLQDFSHDQARYSQTIESEGANLLQDAPAYVLPEGIENISRFFKAADWLAVHFQKRTARGQIAIHSLAVLMGLIFIVYSEVEGLNFLISFFLLTFAAGFVVSKLGEHRQWHRKHLDYRALAEGLRVQIYWYLAGVIDVHSAEFAYDNFLQKQDVELAWIRHVMRTASLSRSRNQQPAPEWLDWVIEQWVGNDNEDLGQLAYYRNKGHEKTLKFTLTTRLGLISLSAGILIALVLTFFATDLSATQRHVLLVLMGILPLIAGIRDAYSHKMAEKELIKQYRFMRVIFANAKRLLDSSQEVEFRRRVLKALGNAALEEDAEWILMHRERPLEHGGL